LEGAIKTKDDCLIGVGYNACIDVGFRAVNLFDALKPEITALQASRTEALKP